MDAIQALNTPTQDSFDGLMSTKNLKKKGKNTFAKLLGEDLPIEKREGEAKKNIKAKKNLDVTSILETSLKDALPLEGYKKKKQDLPLSPMDMFLQNALKPSVLVQGLDEKKQAHPVKNNMTDLGIKEFISSRIPANADVLISFKEQVKDSKPDESLLQMENILSLQDQDAQNIPTQTEWSFSVLAEANDVSAPTFGTHAPASLLSGRDQVEPNLVQQNGVSHILTETGEALAKTDALQNTSEITGYKSLEVLHPTPMKPGILKLELSPVHLGKVDVSVSIAFDGRIDAVVETERPESFYLLSQNSKELQQVISDSFGKELYDFELSMNMHNQSQENDSEQAHNNIPQILLSLNEDTISEAELSPHTHLGIDVNRAMDKLV